MGLYEMVPDGVYGGSNITGDMVVWVQAPSAESMAVFAERIEFDGNYHEIMDRPPEDMSGIDFIIDELGEIIDRRV